MKIHCIRHEPFEGLATIKNWIAEKKGKVSFTHTYLNQHYPEDFDFELLIIMGGTASVYDEKIYTWLPEEKHFVLEALTKNKKVLGICLGAQILASAMGARVYPGTEKEIGWYSVDFCSESRDTFSFLPENEIVFHWHGDTFDIPPDCTRLASSEVTPNQGFIYGNQVCALQFHLEMNRESLKKIIRGAGEELGQGGAFVQSAEDILAKSHQQEKANNKLMFALLDHLENT